MRAGESPSWPEYSKTGLPNVYDNAHLGAQCRISTAMNLESVHLSSCSHSFTLPGSHENLYYKY